MVFKEHFDIASGDYFRRSFVQIKVKILKDLLDCIQNELDIVEDPSLKGKLMGEIERFQGMLKEKVNQIEESFVGQYRQISDRISKHIESEIRRMIEKMMK